MWRWFTSWFPSKEVVYICSECGEKKSCDKEEVDNKTEDNGVCVLCKSDTSFMQDLCTECDRSTQSDSLISFGKYQGNKFEYVRDSFPDYCDWVMQVENPRLGLSRFQRWLLNNY